MTEAQKRGKKWKAELKRRILASRKVPVAFVYSLCHGARRRGWPLLR